MPTRIPLGCSIHQHDADEIDAELDRRFLTGGELNRGQKSCALQHVEALQRIAGHGWQRCLVLEDDVVLADGFIEGVEAALAETRELPHPFVVYLGAGGNFYTPASERRPGRRVYEAGKGRFADSYIAGAEEARLRLALIRERPMHKPIDVTFETIDRQAGIRFLWLEDPVVEQGSKLGMFRSSLEAAPPNFLQAADGQLKLNDFELSSSGQQPGREKELTLDLAGTADVKGGQINRVLSASLQVRSGSDDLRTDLLQPVVAVGDGGPWPLGLKARGNLATWLPRLRPFVPVGDRQLAGVLSLDATARVSAQKVDAESVKLQIDQFQSLEWDLAIDEPTVRLDAQGTWDAAQGGSRRGTWP